MKIKRKVSMKTRQENGARSLLINQHLWSNVCEKISGYWQTKKWSVVKIRASVSWRQIAAHGAKKLMFLCLLACVRGKVFKRGPTSPVVLPGAKLSQLNQTLSRYAPWPPKLLGAIIARSADCE